MITTVEAFFDGKVFLPSKPIHLKPNTRVKLIFETLISEEEPGSSFLETALSLNLDGPPDWATNLDDYLYGGKLFDEK